MKEFLLVGCGGFFGAMGRHGVAVLINRWFPATPGSFPWATFSANVIGCFLIGAVFVAWDSHECITKAQKLFMMTGVLGGFTTFSSFGLDTHLLINTGHIAMAVTYMVLSVLAGVLAVLLGVWLLS